MIVHSYARFSDPSQEGGDSLRRQRESAKEFCKRRGWRLSKLEFADLGRSGWKGNKQKALTAFLEAIDDGRVKPGETLLVEAVDRLSRKGVRATQVLVNRILNAGVNIAILSPVEKIYHADDHNDIGGAIELAAFAFQANAYSENLSTRIKASTSQIRREYKAGHRGRISPIYPGWLSWNKKKEKFDLRPEAVKAVRYIFRRTIEGVGRKVLLRELNQKFAPISSRKNSHSWNETLIYQIIRSRRVLGELKSSTGEVFKDYYPRILDEETWKAANVSATSRKRERGPQTESVNLFNGLLFHAKDDCAMGCYQYSVTRKGGKKKYRRYKSYLNMAGKPGTSSETVDQEKIEEMIFEFLPNLQLEIKGDNEYKVLLDEQSYLQNEIEALQSQISDRSGSAKVLGSLLTDLAEQLENVQKKIDSTDVKPQEPSKSYRTKLSKMRRGTLSERYKVRNALRSIVKRIEILPVKLGTKRCDRVMCLLEIHFRNGQFVRAIEFPEKLVEIKSVKITETLSQQIKKGWTFTSNDYEKLKNLCSEQ
jgi:DNA invertase Pin-like site-specific DNA recombinase